MKEINDLYDYGYKIVQNSDYFKFSLDSMLLANFVNINMSDSKLLDFCTGNCPIPIILSNSIKNIVAFEVQKEIYELGDESLKLNNINTEHIDDEFIKIKVIDKYIPQNDCVFKIYIKDNQVKVEKVEENCDIELDINSITQLAFSYLDINEIFMLNEIDESCLTYNKRKLSEGCFWVLML